MKTFILVVITMIPNPQQYKPDIPQVSMQEMSTEASCNYVADTLKKMLSAKGREITAYCFDK